MKTSSLSLFSFSENSFRIRLLAVMVFGWYLFNILLHVNYLELLWGSDAVFWRGPLPSGVVNNVLYRLSYVPSDAHWVLSIHIVSATLGMFTFSFAWIFRLLAWLTGWMLYLPVYPVFDSGMLCVQSFAFLLIFHRSNHSFFSQQVNRYLAIALTVTLAIGYLASTAYKVAGTHWLNGTAFYYACHLKFIAGSGNELGFFHSNDWISKLFTWSIMFYQFIFPIAVWFKKSSRLWLLIGVIFHLGTIFFFNLWGFAFAMLACYSVLLSDNFAANISLRAIRE